MGGFLLYMKRQDLTSECWEIYFQNWLSLSQAFESAGGNSFFVLKSDDIENFLVSLATNNIRVNATHQVTERCEGGDSKVTDESQIKLEIGKQYLMRGGTLTFKMHCEDGKWTDGVTTWDENGKVYRYPTRCDIIGEKPQDAEEQGYELNYGITESRPTLKVTEKKYSVCDGCGRSVDISNGGGHEFCSYVWGRRGWRQLGAYDG